MRQFKFRLEKLLEFAGEFFDVREAMFEGSYSRRNDNEAYVKIKAKIVFCGQHMDIEFEINLKNIAEGAKALMERLVEPLGDMNFVPDVIDIPSIDDLFN